MISFSFPSSIFAEIRRKKRFIRNNTSTCNTPHKVINTIENVTDVNVTDSLFHNNADDDDDDDYNGGKRQEKMKANVGANLSYAHQQKQGEKFLKRQISRELFVVNQDGSSNQCDKSDNDNNNRVGSNCEHNKGRTHTPTATSAAAAAAAAPSSSGKSGNRRKNFPDSSSLSFAEFESPRFIETSLTEKGLASTSTPTAASNYTAKINRSIDEMSTPNSSLHFNNTTRSSLGGGGGNSSRKSFDYSGNRNNNSISRRNTSSPMCLGDFINTSGASSSGKQGTMMAASAVGKCGKFNLELIKT